MRREFLARALALALLAAAAAMPFVLRDRLGSPTGTLDLRGRMPENGGWSLEDLTATTGEPLHLRMTSDDVLHGFAVGLTDFPVVDIHPGEWTETSLVFDRPGKYTYYCTRWCGPNHWRMRGTILVSGEGPEAPPAEPPLFVRLGIDLDAPHPAQALPQQLPSAERGALLSAQLPAELLSPEVYARSSKADLWQQLRGQPELAALSDADLWDAVAYIWSTHNPPEEATRGAELYSANCAACHGQTGQGDGVMMPELEQMPGHDGQPAIPAELPDFSDPASMYGASPALLEGMLLRGGMGTGMPAWGAILPAEDLDALLAFLYTLSEPAAGP